jgi:hypothetical protein
MISLYRQFLTSMHRLKCRADAIYGMPGSHQDWRFRYASITILSEVWQTWCRFCAQLIVSFCCGTQLRDGTIVSSRPGNNSRQRIAFEISELSRGRIPHRTNVARFTYQEPTWGDVNLLLRVLPSLGISHYSRLITALGISVQSPSHLQIVRNACNHLNSETMQRVKAIQPYYIGSVNQHPCELMWCLESSSRSDAIYFWLDELQTIAELAT